MATRGVDDGMGGSGASFFFLLESLVSWRRIVSYPIPPMAVLLDLVEKGGWQVHFGGRFLFVEKVSLVEF